MFAFEMSSLSTRIFGAAVCVIAVVALLKVFHGEPQVAPPAPTPTLRAVPARELTLRDGRAYWNMDIEPFTGWIVEHYPDGSSKSRSLLSNGVLNGVSEGWHTNGTLQVREHFQDGVSHGLRTKWFESGAKLSEAEIQHGKISGRFRRWHENGPLAEEIQMTDNIPDGVSRAFYPSGARKTEARVEKGAVVEQRFWKEDESPLAAASSAAQ